MTAPRCLGGNGSVCVSRPGAAVLVAAIVIVLVLALSSSEAPSVVGLTLDQAQQLAAKAGMTVDVTAQIPSFDKPAGTILEQAPDPGIASEDNVLRLTVSREPIPVTVTEIKDQLPTLLDGKTSTTWRTELYKSAAFGNLKNGVGLDFTLAGEATIIEIVSTVDGWKGQLRQDTSSGSQASIATLDGTSNQIITLRQPISAGRIWITKLTELTTGRYGVELSEIRFYK
jgi:hypothetical protein